MIFIFSIFLSFLSFQSVANNTLDDLLKKIIEEREFQTQDFRDRENRFQQEKNYRKQLLKKAMLELKKEEKISVRLTKTFEAQEKELSILETELNLAVGVLGELFGVVKQVAGDFRAQLLNSLVSAEILGREKFAEAISSRKKLPTTKELRRLWFEMQREMTELGKVTQFQSEVTTIDGKQLPYQITRIGGFNLVSNGQYLNYESSIGKIVELTKQPQRRFTRYIDDLEEASDSYTMFALDPSRGSLISVLIRVPSVWERVKQGGLVGLIIICVLVFGLALVIERWFILRREGNKMSSQLQDLLNLKDNNPIGQLLLTYKQNPLLDIESLELKLNEIVIKYQSYLERGIDTIKVLAVLAPLLGLLGTVTGMILTFQSITLFGTGDPKLMAGGISQALITTVLGLCCAIPLILFHNFISGLSQNIIQILEEQTLGLLSKRMEKK